MSLMDVELDLLAELVNYDSHPNDSQHNASSQLMPDEGISHLVPGSPTMDTTDDDVFNFFEDGFEFRDIHPEVVGDAWDGDVKLPVPVPRCDANVDGAKPIVQGDDKFKVVAPANSKPLYGPPKDIVDRAVQKLFPEWTLRLERAKFNQWRKKAKIRKLSQKENDLLKTYRRTMLARVYADNARQRRNQRAYKSSHEVQMLRSENERLRIRIAELEQLLDR